MNKEIIEKVKVILFAILSAIGATALGIFIMDYQLGPTPLHIQSPIIIKLLQFPVKLYSLYAKPSIGNILLLQNYAFLILSLLFFGLPLIILAIREFLKRKEPIETKNKYLCVLKVTFISFLIMMFNAFIYIFSQIISSSKFHRFIKANNYFNLLIVIGYFIFSIWDIIKSKRNTIEYSKIFLLILTTLNLLLFLFVSISPLVFESHISKSGIKIYEKMSKHYEKMKRSSA